MNLRKRKLEDEANSTSADENEEITTSRRQKNDEKSLSARTKGTHRPKPLKKIKKISMKDEDTKQENLLKLKLEDNVKLNLDSGKSNSTSNNTILKGGRPGRSSNGNVAIKAEKESFKSEKTSKSKASKKNDCPVSPPLKYEDLGAGPLAVPKTGKMYVGCHVSAAGGVWNSFANGRLCSASAIAMFLRNQRSWNAKPLEHDAVKKWKEASDVPPNLILPHGSYLMNLGSPKEETLKKSRALFVEELQRCEKLGIPHFNFHPGSTLGEISREECCKMIAESINMAHKQTSTVICVIENMSKQGFTVGGDLHEIRLIIEGVIDRRRVGVCIDTCHAHAAGYDLASEKGFDELVNDFEKVIGWQFLRALHLNDSKGKVGDHKDRHEAIGKGFIGIKGFERIMNYPRFRDIPLILETPFVTEDHYAKEIKLLQKMVKVEKICD